jgi:hypothetical protein
MSGQQVACPHCRGLVVVPSMGAPGPAVSTPYQPGTPYQPTAPYQPATPGPQTPAWPAAPSTPAPTSRGPAVPQMPQITSPSSRPILPPAAGSDSRPTTTVGQRPVARINNHPGHRTGRAGTAQAVATGASRFQRASPDGGSAAHRADRPCQVARRPSTACGGRAASCAGERCWPSRLAVAANRSGSATAARRRGCACTGRQVRGDTGSRGHKYTAAWCYHRRQSDCPAHRRRGLRDVAGSGQDDRSRGRGDRTAHVVAGRKSTA